MSPTLSKEQIEEVAEELGMSMEATFNLLEEAPGPMESPWGKPMYGGKRGTE